MCAQCFDKGQLDVVGHDVVAERCLSPSIKA
jgi:hypothetical protein